MWALWGHKGLFSNCRYLNQSHEKVKFILVLIYKIMEDRRQTRSIFLYSLSYSSKYIMVLNFPKIYTDIPPGESTKSH